MIVEAVAVAVTTQRQCNYDIDGQRNGNATQRDGNNSNNNNSNGDEGRDSSDNGNDDSNLRRNDNRDGVMAT